MTVEFNWHIPVGGDGLWRWQRMPARFPHLEYLTQVAQAAEMNGFDRLLVPTAFSNGSFGIEAPYFDSYTTGVAMLAATRRIEVLIAHRPGFVNPGVFAQMCSTADHLGHGRLALNVVTAGAPGDMEQYGDYLDHDTRYQRASEYVTVLQQLWSRTVTNHQGQYYTLKDARLEPKPVRPGGPPMFLAGASEAALDMAARQADVYMMSAEVPERIGQRIRELRNRAAAFGRTMRFCVAGLLITRETDDAAKAHARAMVEHADLEVVAERKSMGRMTTSVEDLRARAGTNMHTWASPTLWSGLTHLAFGSAWVGSYETIADLFLEYVDVGVDIFQLYGNPYLEEAYRMGEEILPRVKARLKTRGTPMPILEEAVA